MIKLMSIIDSYTNDSSSINNLLPKYRKNSKDDHEQGRVRLWVSLLILNVWKTSVGHEWDRLVFRWVGSNLLSLMRWFQH